jgi:hypothetical protein
MGKRKKRLTMAKYAKKYATIRASRARLRGQEVTLNETTTTQEDTLSAAPPAPQAEIPAEAVPMVSETKKSLNQENNKNVSVSPVKIAAKKPEPIETVREMKTKTLAAKPKPKAKKATSRRKAGKRTTATKPTVKAKTTSRN